MAFLSLKEIGISYGDPALLENVALQIEKGDRICIVGRNGSGKSTLMKIISEDLEPDCGEIVVDKSVKRAFLPQEVPIDIKGSVFSVVAELSGKVGALISRYHELEKSPNPTIEDHNELERIHSELETYNGYEIENEINTVITKMNLKPDDMVEELSGGQKRRVILAGAIAGKPDILLMDEPTNHLDIDSIKWMEEFLLRGSKTIVFVTHDRTFLRKIATRIIEIDRGKVIDWNCNYNEWLEKKEHLLEVEKDHNYKFDKKLAAEEAWLRKGIKARRTRNEGRVRALLKLREERKLRRTQQGNIKIAPEQGKRGAKIVIETGELSFSWNKENLLINNLTTKIARGDKVGIIGPNGSGKTTLIKLLLGELKPTNGWAKIGMGLDILYFDQLRMKLDDSKSVKDNVADGKDMIIINNRQKHILGYLQEFLFPPKMALSPVSTLSGGERNRLLLAKLFTQESNFLVMDEPTNDLDVETLELLENILVDYKGTLIVVSHDRSFLNNVVTSTLVMESNGHIGEYAGGYDDYILQSGQSSSPKKESKPKKVRVKPKGIRKLTYKENKELDELPEIIETLEQEQSDIFKLLADPKFYRDNGEKVQEMNERLKFIESDLEIKYKRWEELEEIKDSI